MDVTDIVLSAEHEMAHQLSVLLVEDEWLICEMVAAELTAQGFSVHAVSNAADALTHLQAGEPVDVLVTDIDLAGGMDGIELAQRARGLRPDLPILYASGAVAAKKSPPTLPGSTFLPKPYSPSRICELVTKLAGPGAGNAAANTIN